MPRLRTAMSGLACLALAACSGPNVDRNRFTRDLKPVAQPGEVVATELGFAAMARDEGQWTAFAEYAADDAVMFVPEPVNAKEWLKGRANPPQAVTWEPHQVWSSCDGSLAVSTGAYEQPDGQFGRFVTVWERQEKDGSYKFVLDKGEPLDEPLVEPEMVQAEVADCGGDPEIRVYSVGQLPPDRRLAWSWDRLSHDATLHTRIEGEKLLVWLWEDGARTLVFDGAVGPVD